MTMVLFFKKELRDMVDWYLSAGIMPQEVIEAVRDQMILLDVGPESVMAETHPKPPPRRPAAGGGMAKRPTATRSRAGRT